MNDRELLELAAKAAGMNVFQDPLTGEIMETQVRETDGAWRQVFWNPLLNDGDALKLAVKLELIAYPPTSNYSKAQCQNNDASIDIIENVIDCSYSATRRSIVRAAAEIGRLIC